MPYSRTNSRRKPRISRPLDRATRTGAALFLLLILVAAGTVTSPATFADGLAPYGVKALVVAASKQGAPYAYGAAGPNRFDCSGLMLYAFRKAGKRLPRTAEQQYELTEHIRRRHRSPGDLVFFPTGGAMGHVGIYAGHGRIWHAPRPGARVRLERIWTRNVRYGRAT
ncbi:C40 family peptidase [Streptomyces sp. NPDC059373]